MGILDFLFEDNHRRPPRKKVKRNSPTNPGSMKGYKDSAPTGAKKTIKSSEFHKEKKELRIHDFRNKRNEEKQTTAQTQSTASFTEKPVSGIKETEIKELKNSFAVNNDGNTSSKPTPATDPDLTFIRNKKLHTLLDQFLAEIKEALGENYKGTLAFDTLSEASVSDLMSPAQAYESHIKKAMSLFNGFYWGKPQKALFNTDEYIIYLYVKERFIFNIFVSKENISEGILLHSLSRILKETN